MSQEVRLIAKCDLKSGAWEKVSSVVKECVAQSRKEKGNHLYTAYFEHENHNRVIFIEHWASQQVLELHMTTEHFQNLVTAMKPYLAQPMEITLLDEI